MAYLEQDTTQGIFSCPRLYSLQATNSSLALADSIWNVSWNTANQLVTASADGHIRVWDVEELRQPVHDIDSHPLAITSLSVADKKALASSLDGTIVLVDTVNGEQLGKVNSGRVKVSAEGPGEPCSGCSEHAFFELIHADRNPCFCLFSASSKCLLGVVRALL